MEVSGQLHVPGCFTPTERRLPESRWRALPPNPDLVSLLSPLTLHNLCITELPKNQPNKQTWAFITAYKVFAPIGRTPTVLEQWRFSIFCSTSPYSDENPCGIVDWVMLRHVFLQIIWCSAANCHSANVASSLVITLMNRGWKDRSQYQRTQSLFSPHPTPYTR